MKRFRLIYQHDARQCGAACIAMLCRHYGKNIALSDIEKSCGAAKDGISMLAISNVATRLGFDNITARADIDSIPDGALPAILFWNQNHFVILYHIDKRKGRYHIADPAKGLVVYSKSEILLSWARNNSDQKGILMYLEPNENFYSLKSSSEDKTKTIEAIRFIIGYMSRYRKYMLHIIGGILIASVLQLIIPFLTQSIVDIGIRYNDIGFIWLVLLGEFLIIVGKMATDFVRRWILLHISMRINISLVSDFFIKLVKLPMSYFDSKITGDLQQRMEDHDRIQRFMTNQLINITFVLFSIIIFGVVLFIYNKLIFIVFICASILYSIWTVAFLKNRQQLDYDFFEKHATKHDLTYQFINSMQEIKLQNCEKRRRWEWEDTQADVYSIEMKLLRLQQIQEAGTIFINEIRNILITVISAMAVINGDMTLGAMLATQYVVGQLSAPVEQAMSFIYNAQDVKISLERINEIHSMDEENDLSHNIRTYGTDNLISFENVSFKYDIHSLRNTLSNITFSIPKNKITAIVGTSGSGKTTLLKLLLGYYKPFEGVVKLRGNNLNNYDLNWWRQKCGVVMQNGTIFYESIGRNIAVDDNDIDNEKLIEAARIANIHDDIMRLPNRYDTIIGKDGVGLSQGQKQRILIARAVYRNPDYIILDEATNSLDTKNERAIVDNLNNFYKDKTVVVVAHRLSTVRNADQIIVIEDGRILEIGNHETLIKNNNAYYKLIKNQLELGG